MPVIVDSRGITTYISDAEAEAQAAELAARAEQALDIADARGWPLNASDAQRVQHDLDEAARLLTDIGEYKQQSGPVDLARFYAPGESEAVLAARATAEERRREQTRRMAAAALMIDELGEGGRPRGRLGVVDQSVSRPSQSVSDEFASVTRVGADANPSVTRVGADDDSSAPERVNMKRSFDSHGLEWWTVSGRGETKRYADYATAEREARRRVGRA